MKLAKAVAGLSARIAKVPNAVATFARSNLAATWVGSIAAVAALVFVIWPPHTDKQDSRSTSATTGTSRGSGGGITSDQGGEPSAGEATTPAPQPCADRATGAGVNCHSPAAGFVVRDSRCETPSILGGLAVDPLASLLVESVQVRGTCLVFPTAEAVAAGSTAADLVGLPNGQIPDRLRACAQRGGMITVSCAKRHDLEWVGAWARDDGQDPSKQCLDNVKDYTGNSLTDPSGMEYLVVRGSVQGQQSYRCAVSAGRALNGSVWKVAYGPLPVG